MVYCIYVLDSSNLLEEGEIIDIREPSEMDHSAQPMMLDVVEREVSLVINL